MKLEKHITVSQYYGVFLLKVTAKRPLEMPQRVREEVASEHQPHFTFPYPLLSMEVSWQQQGMYRSCHACLTPLHTGQLLMG